MSAVQWLKNAHIAGYVIILSGKFARRVVIDAIREATLIKYKTFYFMFQPDFGWLLDWLDLGSISYYSR